MSQPVYNAGPGESEHSNRGGGWPGRATAPRHYLRLLCLQGKHVCKEITDLV